ncbi:zinc finger protein CONSTANS-LIKE 2-like [Andrographis paniculata]|uniref:zinc finger protein CONSTANS-LIKE 2-like n=1 Tax=Andrographis paniculata TaxID=175694 RepID=UPI0021E82B95|nr:zinc finger protein CONSTANS-LIKE 2-like [Andrographis paniculata]
MFGHNNSYVPPPNYNDDVDDVSGADFPNMAPFCTPAVAIPAALIMQSGGDFGYASSSSYGSFSTQSLHKTTSELYSPMTASPSPPGAGGYFESEASSSVRKAMSTGDLQGTNSGQQRSNSPLANEMSILESMSRASPYSPEEKKERIERYRNKRNLRNFNKKIKYECRKTLADSRPRIRGRFARNDEVEKIPDQSQWDHTGGEEYDEDSDNWINFLDTFSGNLMP